MSDNNKIIYITKQSIGKFSFLFILLITSLAVFVPLFPQMPSIGLDPSWKFGMNEAVANGFAIGKTIIFTFGPYAGIYTKVFHPETDLLILAASIYFSISFTLAAYLNFYNSIWYTKAILLVIISGLLYLSDPILFFYPLLIATYVIKECKTQTKINYFDLKQIFILSIMFAPLGLLSLVKGSGLISSVAVISLSSLMLLRRHFWIETATVWITPIVSLFVFWKISGQLSVDLIYYLSNSFQIISGYSEAMSINGNPYEPMLYVLSVLLIIKILFNYKTDNYFEKIILLLLYCSMLFLAFKAGFVRHDGHAIIASTFLLITSLLVTRFTDVRRSLILIIVSSSTWVYIDASHVKTSTFSILENIKRSFSVASHGIYYRLVYPNEIKEKYEFSLNKIRQQTPIPILKGSTDIYSYDQSLLIASGNEWNPRPVFQSYSAYTQALAAVNKDHLLGATRPDNILLKIQPIDGRFPSLDDGSSWPVLFTNYEPSFFTNGFLVLHARDIVRPPDLKLIESGIYRFGESITIPKSEDPLYFKTTIRKSIIGLLVSTLFKVSELDISIELINGDTRKYRLVSEMANSGFIVSPLIVNAEEFSRVYENIDDLSTSVITSIKISASRFPFLWNDKFQIELSKVLLP